MLLFRNASHGNWCRLPCRLSSVHDGERLQIPQLHQGIIVEDQLTEEADSDTDDNENQGDFSEEIEEENPESSSQNEDYPGEDVVEIINLQGETTTVYKLVDGRYMDRTNTVYIYDGKDT